MSSLESRKSQKWPDWTSREWIKVLGKPILSCLLGAFLMFLSLFLVNNLSANLNSDIYLSFYAVILFLTMGFAFFVAGACFVLANINRRLIEELNIRIKELETKVAELQ